MNPISSVMLIEMLKQLSFEVVNDTLPYLLLINPQEQDYDRLKYGLTKKAHPHAQWMRYDKWKNYATSFAGNDEKMLKKFKETARSTGLNQLLVCIPDKPESIINLENQFISVFDKIFELQYKEKLQPIKALILRLLKEYDAPTADIEYISTLESYYLISQYLVTRAQENHGQRIQKLSHMHQKDSILELRTTNELIQMGLSTQDIANQLMANDAALYGADVLAENAGTNDQWSEQLSAASENWFFFCEGTKIVGNWSHTYLSPEEEKSVREGSFRCESFTLDSVNYPITASDQDVIIYILNISLNKGYDTTENWIRLWKSFGAKLKKLLESGITVKSIYTDLFLPDHKKIFEKMGFEYLVPNVISGDVYHLDLRQKDISKFSWIMPDLSAESPDPTYLGQPISFRQLSSEDHLSAQEMADIAALVYDTDDYVSPPLFSRRQAKKILPYVFDSKMDPMFNLGNVFCAIASSEKGNRIVGIILHKRGPLNWSSEHLLRFAKLFGEKLPDTVEVVEKEYFKGYDKTPSEARAILNVCVNSNFRMRDELRLGTEMMKAFLQEHPDERLELYVLQETAAMRLYLRNGFIISGKCNGFSIPMKDLPCFFMYRPAK